MTTQELRELDAWIDRNLFETSKRFSSIAPTYTTSSYFAMDVLKKCLSKLPDDAHICINDLPEVWCNDNNGTQWSGQAETLELAICLFAKQLFSQTTKKETT